MTVTIGNRLAGGFLVALLAVGCAVLWVGIPVGCLWAASKVTDDAAEHYLIVLPAVPIAMILWGRALFWINRLYVRVRLGSAAVQTDPEAEPDEEPRWVRGPLEPLLIVTLVLALIALFAWFFLLAKHPSSQVI